MTHEVRAEDDREITWVVLGRILSKGTGTMRSGTTVGRCEAE